MTVRTMYWWYRVPAFRLLLFLVPGILAEYYHDAGNIAWMSTFCIALSGLLLFSLIPLPFQFRWKFFTGLCCGIMMASTGALLVNWHDIRKDPQWIGKTLAAGDFILARIEEPLTEKPGSLKTLATIEAKSHNQQWEKAGGRIIVYFEKDSNRHILYGDQIIFKRALSPIRNSGNPGAFDYTSYCLRNGITHQVYLQKKDYIIFNRGEGNDFYAFILDCRTWIIGLLKKYIPGEQEQGLAEALLIGYKDDLDKGLVQAYSNTGVVHVIAISGLHLGLIYSILLLLTKPLESKSTARWARLVLIISVLWIFSILAGAQPSVLRSAVMFSFVAASVVLERRTSIFNSLALSALLLLLYNPYWLWDAGFQLSYSAVLSIILFFKPVYGWLQFENRIIDAIWKLMAVTLAAQLLTLPVSLYHFHQLPLLFLMTNVVAVPLSSIILIMEIILCALSFFTPLATWLGTFTSLLIRWMNQYITEVDRIPFAVWSGIHISFVQACFLMVFVLAFCSWLMKNTKILLWTSLFSLLLFTFLHAMFKWKTAGQSRLIVYNVPKHFAMDIIEGQQCWHLADTQMQMEPSLKNFHLQPSRTLQGITRVHTLKASLFFYAGKSICIIENGYPVISQIPFKSIDMLVLAGRPGRNMRGWIKNRNIRHIIIAGSVPARDAGQIKKLAAAQHIPYHIVSESGPFIWQPTGE